VLRYAGRPLAPPLPAARLLPIVTSLAAHLTDLHLRGIAHGAVEPDHVLVDGNGAVRLCGFADGHPADDVRAFGDLVHAVVDPDDRSDTAHALRGVADRCRTDGADARPTMAAIAAALAAAVPRPRAIPTPAPHGPRLSRPVGVTAMLVVLVVALVAALWWRAAPSTSASAPAPTAPTTSTSTTAPRRWPATGPLELRHDGVAWLFGDAPDDVVATGDWDCSGDATPLVVRRNGAVWLVDRWPDGATEVAARYVTTVRDAVDVTIDERDGCDVLTITTRDGTPWQPLRRAGARSRSRAADRRG
jgi:hypothetical protein